MTDKPDKVENKKRKRVIKLSSGLVEIREETRGRKRVNRGRVDMSVDMEVAIFLKSLKNKQGAFISDKVKRSKEFKEFQSQI